MFTLTQQQHQKLSEWINTLQSNVNEGAIGGRFTFSFTPTSLGDVVKVLDNATQQSIDLSEYELW